MTKTQPISLEALLATGIEYRPLTAYPGYLFGRDGSVWSCWWRSPGRKGYLNITMRSGPSQSIKRPIHQLILEAFHGPRPVGAVSRHRPDRTVTNNCADNLTWGTYSQNNGSDRIASGTALLGEAHPNRILTTEDVLEIRALYAAGTTQVSLAARFHTRQANISNIVLRKSWKHV